MDNQRLRMLADRVLEDDLRLGLPPRSSAVSTTSVAEWLRESLESPACRSTHAAADQSVNGAAWWKALDWDTEVLGMRSARVDAFLAAGADRAATFDELAGWLTTDLRENRIEYATARLDARDADAARSLERQGFELIDGIITFGTATSAAAFGAAQEHPAAVSIAGPDNADELAEMSAAAFVLDRFHADPAISDAAAADVHRRWVLSTMDTSSPGVVLRFENDGRTAGFVTVTTGPVRPFDDAPVATIGLIATAAEHRGMGVASALVAGAVHWARANGIEWLTVGTQLANLGAIRLYQKCGCGVSGASFTFRRLLQEE